MLIQCAQELIHQCQCQCQSPTEEESTEKEMSATEQTSSEESGATKGYDKSNKCFLFFA